MTLHRNPTTMAETSLLLSLIKGVVASALSWSRFMNSLYPPVAPLQDRDQPHCGAGRSWRAIFK